MKTISISTDKLIALDIASAHEKSIIPNSGNDNVAQ